MQKIKAKGQSVSMHKLMEVIALPPALMRSTKLWLFFS